MHRAKLRTEEISCINTMDELVDVSSLCIIRMNTNPPFCTKIQLAENGDFPTNFEKSAERQLAEMRLDVVMCMLLVPWAFFMFGESPQKVLLPNFYAP